MHARAGTHAHAHRRLRADMVWLNKLGFADPYGSTSAAVDALFTRGRCELPNGLVVLRVSDDNESLLGATIDCLARSECGTVGTAPDPMLDWVYAPRKASEVFHPLGAPPPPHRLRWFRWLVAYSAYFALARNGLYALVSADDPRVVLAAAVTGPPGTIPYGRMSGGEMGDWCQQAGMEMAIEVLAHNMRNRVLGTWQGQAHAHGDRPHLELVIFGTCPECQGRGLGAALLQFLGDVADADNVPIHLETAGSRNVGFYALKGGFTEVHRSPVASFDHEGGGVAMERLPRAETSGRNGSVHPGAGDGNGDKPGAFHEARSVDSLTAPATPSGLVESTGCHVSPSARSGSDTENGHKYKPKRSAGPLASYCVICGGHRSAHDESDI